MKWLYSLLAFTAVQVVSSAPSELVKRASVNDVANIGYAAQAGTTGGSGGTSTTVTTLAALTAAVAGTAKKVVIVSGTISGNTIVKVGSNTSIIGKQGSALVGVGLRVLNENNVIIRNLKVSKVLADAGDAIGIQASSKVWLDHLDLSSDMDHDKDYYDGLLDITHGCTGVTVSGSKLYNHWKGSLVGHSDSNAAEDTKITVTYANNYWSNINSRTPSFRFGKGHIYNNVFDNTGDGINTRVGAQLLVENNVWSEFLIPRRDGIMIGAKKPLYSTDGGFAVARGNDFGGAANTAPAGTFTQAPYSYTLIATSSVRSAVVSSSGQTLGF
ncbi:hypothetical protein D9615_009602 [Tricholomella constricta]|uniref:pectate lyase n=1 Tax=Tricholomella constricta TaxID=117010 RepID=A0A8H5GUS6_9AGAR|nr:hypothetical protein D9615_009602 [Tricholomella constricta]